MRFPIAPHQFSGWLKHERFSYACAQSLPADTLRETGRLMVVTEVILMVATEVILVVANYGGHSDDVAHRKCV